MANLLLYCLIFDSNSGLIYCDSSGEGTFRLLRREAQIQAVNELLGSQEKLKGSKPKIPAMRLR